MYILSKSDLIQKVCVGLKFPVLKFWPESQSCMLSEKKSRLADDLSAATTDSI